MEIDEIPEEYQIRNSNAYSLAVQVARAGGMPQVLPVARERLNILGKWSAAAWSPIYCCFRGGFRRQI